MHIIIFLHPDHKLHTPEKVDSLLFAEFPDKEKEPELFELVKSVMVHTPCENDHNNPNAPCLIDEKCSKNFPKAISRSDSSDYRFIYQASSMKYWEKGQNWLRRFRMRNGQLLGCTILCMVAVEI